MSLRKRIDVIVIETATKVANQIMDEKIKAFDASSGSGVAEVLEVDGANLKVQKADGSIITVLNSGGRYVGEGDKVALGSNLFGF